MEISIASPEISLLVGVLLSEQLFNLFTRLPNLELCGWLTFSKGVSEIFLNIWIFGYLSEKLILNWNDTIMGLYTHIINAKRSGIFYIIKRQHTRSWLIKKGLKVCAPPTSNDLGMAWSTYSTVGNLARRCQQQIFWSESQKSYFLYLWVFSCVQVGNNGAYSSVTCQSSCNPHH